MYVVMGFMKTGHVVWSCFSFWFSAVSTVVQSPVCVGQGHTWKSIWRTVLAAVVLKALVINKVLVKTDLPNFRKKRIVSSP